MFKLAPARVGQKMTPPDSHGGRRTALVAHPSAEMYGSDRMLIESVAGLVDAGWQVVVTVPSDGPLVAQVEARGARVVLCPSPVLRKAALRPRGLVSLAVEAVRAVPAATRLLRALRPDALYVSTVTIPLWLPLARVMRVPAVCHVHEAERSAPAVVRQALSLPTLLAASVITNSRFSLDVLADSFSSLGRRAQVVYNGVAGPEVTVQARQELAGAVRLLYVGRLSPRKGVDVAVEALADLVDRGVDARLDLLGAVFPGYEWYEKELADLADRRGVADRLHFLGFQPSVWTFVAEADVVLVPSRFDEPFGNTAVEAVLSARPVVVSDTSGLREAAAGYESAQIVTPGDAAALADAVVHVLADWGFFRQAAWRDASVATERHAPTTYRRLVAATVNHLVDEHVDDPTLLAPSKQHPGGVDVHAA